MNHPHLHGPGHRALVHAALPIAHPARAQARVLAGTAPGLGAALLMPTKGSRNG